MRSAPLLFALVVLTWGCRIEKRVVETSYDESRPLLFEWNDSIERGEINQLRSYGQATRSLVPDRKTALAGYGGLGRRLFPPRLYQSDDATVFCRPFESIDSETRIKISLFSGTGNSDAEDSVYIFVNLDLVAVTQDVTQWLMNAARKELPQEVVLNQANFQVLATHTHAGPSGLSLSPVWGSFACDSVQNDYRAAIEQRFRAAVKEAWEGRKAVDHIRFNRLQVQGWNQTRIGGVPVSTETLLLQPSLASGSSLGCLFSFPVHSTFFGPTDLALSRDLAGYLEDGLRNSLGATDCYFMNGSSGNASSRMLGKAPTEYGEAVAADISSQLSSGFAEQHTITTLKYSSVPIELPRPRVNLEACNIEFLKPLVRTPLIDEIPRTSKVSLLQMGDQALAFISGELVSNAGDQMRDAILAAEPELKAVSFLTTANDYMGYILRNEEYAGTSLEACSSLFGVNHLDVVQAGLLRMVE